jgi:hypothetical protein
MLLVNILVGYEDDVFKALWVVENGLLGAAERVNIFNAENTTRIEIIGATQIPDVNIFTEANRKQLEKAGIHITLDDFIYED